ncbi:MAG: hypothetical protein P0Y55_12085 [Candidatus Cohnella colombiensis]|uniref:Uncharacterized protein n=1 Tax=Candidatus Cohnella colombiensis TaxID=3121368 RepID=A0AA95ETW3_9BACL|nr:MAG: hypothetical protein P0Y55_12085 [Cohnella sp.]
MNRVAYNPKNGRLKTDASGVNVKRGFPAHLVIEAAQATAPNTAGIRAAAASTGSTSVFTTGITQPSVPRNITATAGGTAADIKAIQVIIEGTNFNDEVITETLPAFTASTAGTVTGIKAFKTVTKITIPAHTNTGATTAIGFGKKLGIPYKLPHNTVLFAALDNVREATAPTVTNSATAIENNTVDLNTALNSKQVDVYLVV